MQHRSSSVSPVAHTSLFAFSFACLEKLGLSREDAEITAENLMFANLRGVDSHGVIRIKVYADRIRAGGVRPGARPETVHDSKVAALIDAGGGLGQVAATQAMKLAIAKAKTGGAGLVGVRNSNHNGAAAFYSMMALAHGMIGFATTNSGPTMAPTGGCQARLGNNPLSVAIPADKYPPLVLDMATGAVALGKILLARQEGKSIPTTWALDRNGIPTDNPEAAAQGGLIQPIGGYKGYGLSLVIDILTGVLLGSGFSTYVNSLYGDPSLPANCAQLCGALAIEGFMPLPQFLRRVDTIIDLMHSCPRAPGVERVYVPGEIENETEQRRRTEGIPLSAPLIDELRALGAELGVRAPF